jgi:hypothetical protein
MYFSPAKKFEQNAEDNLVRRGEQVGEVIEDEAADNSDNDVKTEPDDAARPAFKRRFS